MSSATIFEQTLGLEQTTVPTLGVYLLLVVPQKFLNKMSVILREDCFRHVSELNLNARTT